MKVQRIPLDLIDLSPFNVRQEIDVGSLTCSLEREGQIEPIRVRPAGERYQLRTGTRQFLALKAAGATHADAIVVKGSDEEVISEQWDENEERADYTDYERTPNPFSSSDPARAFSRRFLRPERPRLGRKSRGCKPPQRRPTGKYP